LIERDAVTLFYDLPGERQCARRVDLATIDDEACKMLLDTYERARVDVGVWEVTSDLGGAAFLVIVLDRDDDPFRPPGAARGTGCHPDAGIALARALCEAAQSRLTRIVGTRDDMVVGDHGRARSRESIAAARAQLTADGRCPRSFRDAPSFVFDTF